MQFLICLGQRWVKSLITYSDYTVLAPVGVPTTFILWQIAALETSLQPPPRLLHKSLGGHCWEFNWVYRNKVAVCHLFK